MNNRDGIYQREDCGGDFWVSYTDAMGRRRRIKAADCHTRTQAKNFLDQLKGKVGRERHLGLKEIPTTKTGDLIKRYLEYQSGLKSIERTKGILDRWAENLPQNCNEIARLHVDSYIAKRRADVSPATLSKELTILRHLCKVAIEWELMTKNPTDGVKLPKVSNGRLRYLSPAEFKKALKTAPEWMRAPLALSVFVGLRRGELLGLRWNDVDLRKKLLYISPGKTGDARMVPLSAPAIAVLERLHELRNGGDHVLVDVDPGRLSVETKRLFKRLGIEDASLHSLRHTFASWLAMGGADLHAIGQLLGHRTAKMTQRYAHLSPEYLQHTVQILNQQKSLTGGRQ